MNILFYWMLLIPLLCSVGLWFRFRSEWPWTAIIALFVPGALATVLAFFVSVGIATYATEIWNGQVTSKERREGTYEESYQCNCRTVTSGSGKNQTSSTQCDTCYRTHYTVKWNAYTTIGDYQMFDEDSLSPYVYQTPNPARWVQVKPGDPVSKTHGYTNYVQAVPESLFSAVNQSILDQWASKVPPYPSVIYDFWYCDHLVQAGIQLPDAKDWNKDIALALRQLGAAKQVNFVVVVNKGTDPTFADALRTQWNGVNKNDVVLVLGTADGQTLSYVRVISWTKNELFKIKLRDEVLAVGSLDRTKILPVAFGLIGSAYERRHMKEFEYLKSEITPPNWILTLLTVVEILSYAGIFIYMIRQED